MMSKGFRVNLFDKAGNHKGVVVSVDVNVSLLDYRQGLR